MKPLYRTFWVCLGGCEYAVPCRIVPSRAASRAGADSPRFLDPGSPPRVQVLRILRDRIDVTGEISWFTRTPIVEDAKRQALEYFAQFLQHRRAMRRHTVRARGRIA